MHPFVRDLYRRFLVVSSTPTRGYRELSAFSLLTTAAVRAFGPLLLQVARDYPLPPEECRRRIREGFLRNSHLTGKEDILRAVHHGRYKCREAIAVIQVRKYRQLKRQYQTTAAVGGSSSTQQQTAATSGGT